MSHPELYSAVIDAHRRREYARCFALLEELIASASGEELGKALSLKAGTIALADVKRATEGLALVDDALQHLAANPGESLLAVTSGLSLCYALGDVERARKYEAVGLRLLQENAEDPVVRGNQFRLFLNLGALALAQHDYATAYWHFVQGTSSLISQTEAAPDLSGWHFWLYLHTATTCLYMNRTPEAEDALNKAEPWVMSDRGKARLTIGRADLLRHRRHFDEALSLLQGLREDGANPWDAEVKVLSYMTRSLVARDQGNLRDFHKHLALAQYEAAENHLDYLLSDIQRIQRTPMEPYGMEGR